MSSKELTYKRSIEKASPLRTHSSYIDGRLSHVWLLASHSFLIGKLHTHPIDLELTTLPSIPLLGEEAVLFELELELIGT